jgi:hypothetical protein
MKTIKRVTYKGHNIHLFEDAWGQVFATIDEDTKLYASIADAKRVIRGENPKFEIS